MDYNRSNGQGCLSVAALIAADGAIAGRKQGIVSAGVAVNIFSIALDPAAGFYAPTWNVDATVQGATAGVAIPFFPTPTTLSVATFSGAGAAAALPFYLSARPRGPGRFVRPPIGDVVAQALVDVADGVPSYVGPPQGISGAPNVPGVGVFEFVMAPAAGSGIDPLNSIIHACAAETADPPLDSFVTVEAISDIGFRVRTFDAGTPADRNFYVTVERVDVG